MIKKFGKVYKVLSSKGKNLGGATSRKAAEKTFTSSRIL